MRRGHIGRLEPPLKRILPPAPESGERTVSGIPTGSGPNGRKELQKEPTVDGLLAIGVGLG
jgi:hypothetical protein